MFQEGEGSAPEGETSQRQEEDVVFRGTVEKPKKDSWWKRTFGDKKSAVAAQPAEIRQYPETDFRKLTKENIANRERRREISRKINAAYDREHYMSPKPIKKETDTVSGDKEAPRIVDEDEAGL